MANTFDFIGQICPRKATDNFDPYKTIQCSNDWEMKVLTFTVIADGNRHTVNITGSKSKNDDNEIYYYSRKAKDMKKVSYAKRHTIKDFDDIGFNNKFIINLNERPKYWYENGMKKPESQESYEMCKAALENYDKNVYTYISNWDFVEAVYDLLNDEKYKNKKFRVGGNVDYRYSKDKFYQQFNVNRIHLMDDTASEKSEGHLDFFFGSDSLDDQLGGTNELIVDGYVGYYDFNVKNTAYATVELTVGGHTGENAEKKNSILKKRFSAKKDEFKKVGIIVNFIDGAAVRDITEDDLTEEQKDMIFLGEKTLEDFKKEQVVSDQWVRKIKFKQIDKAYPNGPEEVEMTMEEFFYPEEKPAKSKKTRSKPVKEVIEEDDDDDDIDIFADEED